MLVKALEGDEDEEDDGGNGGDGEGGRVEKDREEEDGAALTSTTGKRNGVRSATTTQTQTAHGFPNQKVRTEEAYPSGK